MNRHELEARGILSPLCLPIPPLRQLHFIGGDTRIRTGDEDFADPCLTTWRCRHIKGNCGITLFFKTLYFHKKNGAGNGTSSRLIGGTTSILANNPFSPFLSKKMERETGLEPATSTLARLRSTTELFPLQCKTQNLRSGLCCQIIFFTVF